MLSNLDSEMTRKYWVYQGSVNGNELLRHVDIGDQDNDSNYW